MRKVLVSLVSILALACGVPAGPATAQQQLISGSGVEPTVIEGNPRCPDGYAEYKIDNVNGPFAGTFTSSDGYLTVTGASLDGTYFSFTSNRGVDIVLMKGGNAAHAYEYDPESTGDSNLVSPDNNGGQVAAISHVTFCYDYELDVSKTAATSFTRDFAWAIEKTSTIEGLLLAVGQTYTVPYTVTVSSTGHVDSDFAVAGSITISNPSPLAATITAVTDAMGAISAPVDCEQAFPIALAAGASITCTYAAALPDASSLTNVATVTTSGAVKGNSGSAAVDFAGAAITTVDGCVQVSDSMVGDLGEVCAADAPKTFSYSANLGPYTADDCAEAFPVDNVATFVAGSGETGSASHAVTVAVACPPNGGCSLTQGYWKTHSSYGPAPYDANWANLPNGADTAFFNSGLSWYQQFWTAPKGNAYFNLAHQYAAAYLNQLNGADTSAITAQLAAAANLLGSVSGTTIANKDRNAALALASTLDAYNNGAIGPGHCSE